MELNQWLKNNAERVSDEICGLNEKNQVDSRCLNQTSKHSVVKVLNDLRSLIFPGIYETEKLDYTNISNITNSRFRIAALDLCELITTVLMDNCEHEADKTKACEQCKQDADAYAIRVMEELPKIRRLLETDIEAAFAGDPAAKSFAEIILSYPSFEAISIYRIAHSLALLGVPLIPRIMTEYAHERTGIDIHPNATIGPRFFIDHGTGVVIGETCTIGENVKIYQSVTLGAKSFPVDENGNPIKNIKRHPDIGDNVVIYAGATILGGNTIIGENSTIGGNVWLTHSVPKNTTVVNAQPNPILKQKDESDI